MSAPRHLYVHVPFCARRCSYCDFSIAVRRDVPVREYVRAVERELELRAPEAGWTLDSLYMGGGTPSRLGGEGIVMLLDALSRRTRLEPDAEVALEANPDDVTTESARAWAKAGVNRVSLGVQSFDEGVLAWMHRSHGAEAAAAAFEALCEAGIRDVSLDLIFALPEFLQRDWERDLALALQLQPTHLSLYGLTVEPATPLGRWVARGEVIEAPEEGYALEFLRAHEIVTQAGLEHYEVSNFALPGYRARHNSAYWRHVPYAALGPAAHGFDGRRRTWNVSAYADWLKRLTAGEDPLGGSETLDAESRAAEAIYLGLRTVEGLPLFPGAREAIDPWVKAGWAVAGDERVRLTAEGWLRLDGLAASLTMAPSHS